MQGILACCSPWGWKDFAAPASTVLLGLLCRSTQGITSQSLQPLLQHWAHHSSLMTANLDTKHSFRTTCLAAAQDKPHSYVPLLIKPCTYQSAVVLLPLTSVSSLPSKVEGAASYFI